MDIDFRPLYWFYGLIGAAVGIVGAGVVVGVVMLLRDHWR